MEILELPNKQCFQDDFSYVLSKPADQFQPCRGHRSADRSTNHRPCAEVKMLATKATTTQRGKSSSCYELTSVHIFCGCMACFSYDIYRYHFWHLLFFPSGVFFHSRVTGACPVTMDLIMRDNVRATTYQQLPSTVFPSGRNTKKSDEICFAWIFGRTKRMSDFVLHRAQKGPKIF